MNQDPNDIGKRTQFLHQVASPELCVFLDDDTIWNPQRILRKAKKKGSATQLKRD